MRKKLNELFDHNHLTCLKIQIQILFCNQSSFFFIDVFFFYQMAHEDIGDENFELRTSCIKMEMNSKAVIHAFIHLDLLCFV